jgi:phosphinothricin acetyltransferase
MIRICSENDADRLCQIYNHYVRDTIFTFETEEVDVKDMAARIIEGSARHPWLVYEEDNIKGFAYAGPWKPRSAYRHTVESSIYLDIQNRRKGIGEILYGDLINRIKEINIHAILGGIALPNEESVKFHERMGFEKVGQLKEVGYKFNKWIDVSYWELVLV